MKTEPRPLEIGPDNPIVPEDVGRWVVTAEGVLWRICEFNNKDGYAYEGIPMPVRTTDGSTYATDGRFITSRNSLKTIKGFVSPADHCRPLSIEQLLAEIDRRLGSEWTGPLSDLLKESGFDLTEVPDE